MVRLKIIQTGESYLSVKAGGYKQLTASSTIAQVQINRGNTIYETKEYPYSPLLVSQIEQSYS